GCNCSSATTTSPAGTSRRVAAPLLNSQGAQTDGPETSGSCEFGSGKLLLALRPQKLVHIEPLREGDARLGRPLLPQGDHLVPPAGLDVRKVLHLGAVGGDVVQL